MAPFTFVTGWFRRHGIAYLDMALLALERAELPNATPEPGTILVDGEDQYEMARTLGYSGGQSNDVKLHHCGHVVYLVPKGDKWSREVRPLRELVAEGKWDRVLDSVERSDPTCDGWRENYQALRKAIQQDHAFPTMDWFESNWGCRDGDPRLRLLWHVINDAPLQFQRRWYERCSPLYAANKERFEFVEMDLQDEDRPEQVAGELHRWLQRGGTRDEHLLVNMHGTSTAMQFGWYFLAWRMPALKNATFIECRTDKGRLERRFVPIKVKVVPKDPIAEFGRKLVPKRWESRGRKEAKARLEFFLLQRDNFIFLLLGDRGTGKSRSVKEAWTAIGGDPEKFHEANCANFHSGEHARSELFGHVAGAFPSAVRNRDGLFKLAEKGLLFLDEVHHLDTTTRAMLLTALQTDKDGRYSFTPLGADGPQRSMFQLVVASNRCIGELREKLEPDFFDRISQRLLEMPSISSRELKGAWTQVWKEMDFKGKNLAKPVEDEQFVSWLQSQELWGNFRDLQHIAILVADFQRASAAQEDGTKLGIGPDLMTYLRERMAILRGCPRPETADASGSETAETAERPHLVIPYDLEGPEDEKAFIDLCRRQFAVEIASRFGSQKGAIAALKARGSKMSESTLSNWKKGPRPLTGVAHEN